jgi:mannosyl-3-phosphoglycerate phosphatase
MAGGDGTRRDGYEVVEFGLPRAALVDTLEAAARETGVRVRGWHRMDAEEIARRCELPIAAARRAMQREYDEPFVLDDESPEARARLEPAIERRGAHLIRGGRFLHVVGPHDKATAARHLVAAYERHWGPVRIIALGDAPNDAGLLAVADVPVVVASPLAGDIAASVPGALLTTSSGPAGWSEAVMTVLSGAIR